jgi:hypothetical protein
MAGELAGKVFTRLTVLGNDGTRGKNSYLKCQCSCGTVKSVRRDALLKGDVKSCGCLGRELNTAAEAAAEARRKPHRIRKKLIEELNEVFRQGRGMKCEHGMERTRCKDCGGGSICDHDRVRNTCSICEPEKVFRQYIYKSKQRGLTFSLTLQEFETLVNSKCLYCGDPALGIDRVDNRIGYVSTPSVRNCVPCCSECNFAKRVMLAHRFIAMAERIAKHQEKLRKQKSAEVLVQPAA